jgi:uncharacterized iron-regulated membrane protein
VDEGYTLLALVISLTLLGFFIKIVLLLICAALGLLVWTIRMMLWAKRSRDVGMRMLADPNDYRHQCEA